MLKLIIPRDANNYNHVGFNEIKEPFDNKQLRQAISSAIDREAITDALYAGYNSRKPITT